MYTAYAETPTTAKPKMIVQKRPQLNSDLASLPAIAPTNLVTEDIDRQKKVDQSLWYAVGKILLHLNKLNHANITNITL